MAIPPRYAAGSRVFTVGTSEPVAGTLKLQSPPASSNSGSAALYTQRKRRFQEMSTGDGVATKRPHTPSVKLPRLVTHDNTTAAVPPSPVPTEVLDIEAEDFVRTAKNHGVKVRDFAHEVRKPGVHWAPEIWRNPFLVLLTHDMHIRRPESPEFQLAGKALHRLLDSGLVTEKEAQMHWPKIDWEKLTKYRERPGGPYPYRTTTKVVKPSANYRAASRLQYFGDTADGDVSEADIYVPEDGPDMWEGDELDPLGDMLMKRREATADEADVNAAEAVEEASVQEATIPRISHLPLTPPLEGGQMIEPHIPHINEATSYDVTPPTSPSIPSKTLFQEKEYESTPPPAAEPARRPSQLARTQSIALIRVR